MAAAGNQRQPVGRDLLRWLAAGLLAFVSPAAHAGQRLLKPATDGVKLDSTTPLNLIETIPASPPVDRDRSRSQAPQLSRPGTNPNSEPVTPTPPRPTVPPPHGRSPFLAGSISLVFLLAFYGQAWRRVIRRRPRPGTIVPIYSPPDDLSAPAVRYLTKMECDDRTVAAALVDVAVRGHAKLYREYDDRLRTQTLRFQRQFCSAALPQEEKAFLDELAAPGQTIVIGPENFDSLSVAKIELREALEDQYQNRLFKPNAALAGTGMVLLFGALWLTSCVVVASTGAPASGTVFFGFVAIAVTAILLYGLHTHTAGNGNVVSICATISGILAAIYALPMIPWALDCGGWLPLAIPALASPLAITAFRWMEIPTTEGRKVLDHIAGFREYLSIAERERLDRITSPDNPKLFERYLPYAIALGVENHWAEGFQSTLAGATSMLHQTFGWYFDLGSPSLVDMISSASAPARSSKDIGGTTTIPPAATAS